MPSSDESSVLLSYAYVCLCSTQFSAWLGSAPAYFLLFFPRMLPVGPGERDDGWVWWTSVAAAV